MESKYNWNIFWTHLKKKKKKKLIWGEFEFTWPSISFRAMVVVDIMGAAFHTNKKWAFMIA